MCKEIIDPYGFIYITTNLVNGKRYIGQKKFDHQYKWQSYIGSGTNLLKAVKKYGKENFIRNIVDIGYSEEELNDKEKQWIENYNAVNSNDYYNLIEGGNSGSHLRERNSVPVICLNNRMKFNSIIEASQWSGHTTITIKKTYKLNFKKNKGKKLIFRPLTKKCSKCDELFYSANSRKKECEKCGGYFHCEDCGDSIRKIKQRQIRCDNCQEIRKKKLAKLRKLKYKEKLNLSEEELKILINKEIEKELSVVSLKKAIRRPNRVKKITNNP